MNIAIVVDGVIEQIGELRTIFNNVSFPPSGPDEQWLEDNNVKPVTYWKAYDNLTEKLTPTEPYIEDGNVYAVVVDTLTTEEVATRLQMQIDQNRARRDNLLAHSDWIVTKAFETNTPIPQEWLDYRQALRDVPQQGDQFNIDWPTPPV